MGKAAAMRVVARTTYEGIHRWEDAPVEVSFLRNNHRHLFFVEVQAAVFHDDRDIEFITLKHRINSYFDQFKDEYGVYMMGTKSCEQIAEELYTYLTTLWSHIERISVFEDNENGAVLTFNLTF